MNMKSCYFATADEMAELDRLAVESGLEIRQMMELAGWHMLAVLRRLRIKKNKRIVIVAGEGNKGGDGLSAARHLLNSGYSVQIILVGDRRKMKKDARHHLKMADRMNIPIWYWKAESSRCVEILGMSDVIIDAMIGYRLKGSPRAPFRDVIEGIQLQKSKVISYDLPTGIDPTTGIPTAAFVHADATLTLALPKKLFQAKEARKHSGRIFIADIGIPSIVYDQIHARSRPHFRSGGMIEL